MKDFELTNRRKSNKKDHYCQPDETEKAYLDSQEDYASDDDNQDVNEAQESDRGPSMDLDEIRPFLTAPFTRLSKSITKFDQKLTSKSKQYFWCPFMGL